ncbi:MAG: hypothetical protein PHT40_00835 [Patescibacteria group bacterium]|nr:hypothetical protein [Patescibacteria group bacterium]
MLPIFFRNKVIKWNLLGGVVINLAVWIFLYWQVQPQVDPIFLRYNIYFGPSLIGPWWQIFFLPLFGLGVLLANYILAGLAFKKERFVSYFFAYGASLVQILLAILAVYLVGING